VRRTRGGVLAPALAVLVASGLAGCVPAASTVGRGPGRPTADGSGKIRVVASIDTWGSLLAQLGGDRVAATSVISSPGVDPHSYEPTPADAIAIAEARVLVVDGIGYDGWASAAAAANPSPTRRRLDVGTLVGIRPGGNPHQWYSRAVVHRVVDALTADLQAVDPAGRAYYAQRRRELLTVGLRRYDALEAETRAAHRGTPVGGSESVVTPLADTLGLRVLTPPALLRAVSEGTDPAPGDVATVRHQLTGHLVRVYLDNVQNSTPDVEAQVAAARAAGIPVVTVTETLTPRGATFQDWQVAQLEALSRALAAGPP